MWESQCEEQFAQLQHQYRETLATPRQQAMTEFVTLQQQLHNAGLEHNLLRMGHDLAEDRFRSESETARSLSRELTRVTRYEEQEDVNYQRFRTQENAAIYALRSSLSTTNPEIAAELAQHRTDLTTSQDEYNSECHRYRQYRDKWERIHQEVDDRVRLLTSEQKTHDRTATQLRKKLLEAEEDKKTEGKSLDWFRDQVNTLTTTVMITQDELFQAMAEQQHKEALLRSSLEDAGKQAEAINYESDVAQNLREKERKSNSERGQSYLSDPCDLSWYESEQKLKQEVVELQTKALRTEQEQYQSDLTTAQTQYEKEKDNTLTASGS